MGIVTLISAGLRNSRLSRQSSGRSGGRRCFGRRCSWGQLSEVGDNFVNRLRVKVELDAYRVGNQLLGFIIRLRSCASENSTLAFMQDLQLWENFRLGSSVVHCWVNVVIWGYPSHLEGVP